jgi:hypothetical protein
MKAQTRKAKMTAESPASRRGGRRRSAETKRRKKISTTIAPESYAFLERLIESGKAVNLAEAIDMVLEESRRAENRARLEQATQEYFDSRSPEELAEDAALEIALGQAAARVDFSE